LCLTRARLRDRGGTPGIYEKCAGTHLGLLRWAHGIEGKTRYGCGDWVEIPRPRKRQSGQGDESLVVSMCAAPRSEEENG